MKTKKLLLVTIITSVLTFFSLKTNAQALVKDFAPNEALGLTTVNSTLFFQVGSSQLWKTDGTNSGTVMIKDFSTGANSLRLHSTTLTDVNGTLFFAASDANYMTQFAPQLWKSDGTASGTIMLKDLAPGANAPVSGFTAVNNSLFFVCYDPNYGEELFISDGTPGGTFMVTDIYPGSGGGLTGLWYANVNGTLYFEGSDNTYTYALFKSDGTAGGTVPVACTGACGVRPKELINANGILYFYAQEPNSGSGWEIWRSDGTPAGTFMIKDIYSGFGNDAITAYYGYLTNVNGIVYFKATDGVNGQELWKTDGTVAGTVMVKDISTTNSVGSVPMNLINVNGTLFFTATDNTSTTFLWKTDGTDAGTAIVSNSATFATGTYLDLVAVGNKLFFVGGGYQLTKTDGTDAGTQVLATYSSGPVSLTDVNGVLYYTVGKELWKYDPAIVGVNEMTEKASLSIFPNPTNGKFTIELPYNHQQMNVEVYNVLGEKIFQQQNTNEINLSASPKGVYFVRIYDDKKSYTTKISVE